MMVPQPGRNMSLRIPASRRLLLVGALVGLVACGGSNDLASLRTQVIAEVPGTTLTGADLERWLMASPDLPNDVTASVLVSAWIDQALVAEALRQKLPLESPALADSAVSVDLAMAEIFEVYSARNRSYPAVTDAQADSLFDADNVRVFQQVIVKVLPPGDEDAQVKAGERAEVLRASAATTPDFTRFVREVSEDTAHARTGAFNPARTRDDMPEGQMGGHLWTLRPGDVSRVFSSSEIAIFFHRSGKEAARPELKRWLFPRYAGRSDSLFVDSLVAANQVSVEGGALSRLRSMAGEPVPSDEGGMLATWTGGGLTASGARYWLLAMDPRQRADLTLASDRQVEDLLMEMSRRELLLAYGRARGGPNDSLRIGLRERYMIALVSFQQAYGSGETGMATRMLDSMTVAGRAYLPVPRGLAGMLRGTYEVKVYPAIRERVAQAVATAWAERRAAEPTNP